MYCKNCGALMEDGSTFCNECGICQEEGEQKAKMSSRILGTAAAVGGTVLSAVGTIVLQAVVDDAVPAVKKKVKQYKKKHKKK